MAAGLAVLDNNGMISRPSFPRPAEPLGACLGSWPSPWPTQSCNQVNTTPGNGILEHLRLVCTQPLSLVVDSSTSRSNLPISRLAQAGSPFTLAFNLAPHMRRRTKPGKSDMGGPELRLPREATLRGNGDEAMELR